MTSLAPGNDDGCSKQTVLPLVTAAISLASRLSRDREPIRVDRRSCGFAWTLLRPKAYTSASPAAAMCQALVAERQLSSRLNGGEAVMSHALRSTPAKRGTNRKGARKALFDPAVFLETTANGRVISTHSKRDVIFAQGDDADSVFYIRKAKSKSPSYPSRARKPSSRSWGQTNLLAKDA